MKIKFFGDLNELSEGISIIAEMLDVTLDDGEYVFEVTQKKENKLTLKGKSDARKAFIYSEIFKRKY